MRWAATLTIKPESGIAIENLLIKTRPAAAGFDFYGGALMKVAIWIVGIIVIFLVLSGGKKEKISIDTESYQAPPSDYQAPQINSPSSSYTTTFAGYPCTVDCSGHEAGYKWAEENGIDDPDDCGGNSDSFVEGCQAFAEEQQTALGESSGDE